MPYVVDNPGGGDCGFYALAIGLIDNIKKQAKSSGTSPLYNQLKALTDVDVSLEDITSFTLHRRSSDQKSLEVLSKLQLSLRHIAAETVKDDLLAKIQREQQTDSTTLVEGSIVFIQFSELVQAYKKSQSPNLTEIQKFNELALSPTIQALAKRTATELNQKLEGKTDFAEIHRIETAFVKKAFKQDIYDGHQFKSNSIILKGIDAVKVPGRWGTHNNLKMVADALHVNFRVNGFEDGVDLPGQPTVRLNNLHNAHWTTTVSGTAPEVKTHKTAKGPTAPVVHKTKKTKTSYHTMTDKLDLDAKKESVIETMAHHASPGKQDSVREEVRQLLEKADDIHDAAEKAREKEAQGGELTDEELAAKLQDDAFRQTFKP